VDGVFKQGQKKSDDIEDGSCHTSASKNISIMFGLIVQTILDEVVHYVLISQIYRRATEPARLRGAMRH
jgi:hypothetical protein